ncbi:MAG: RsmB/NOP family class I SAM-dependent RNA methyltransferase, partial [Leadbetterella sp.]
KELQAMHMQAPVCIRTNTLKTTKQELSKALSQQNIETTEIPFAQDGLYLSKRQNVFGLAEFKNGLFEVQDAGSQLISEFLDVHPGQRVVDACAGAGGKSLHIANLLKNKGSIISMDVEQFKLDELKTRAKRNGIFNIETRLIESKTIKRMHDSADRLLLDVPCSGVGVLRRNPDAKWKLKPEFIAEIQELQYSILERYSKILRSGGKMVYATCSLLPSENQNQIESFLTKNTNFELLDQKTIYPSEFNSDGYFMALLTRKD